MLHHELIRNIWCKQQASFVNLQLTVADLSKSFSCLLLFCCASLSLVLHINIAKVCTGWSIVTGFGSTLVQESADVTQHCVAQIGIPSHRMVL